ncbi:unnamed protein product [Adineta steineri]|uniref:Uncharacterized protein n=1 Tax=Adineta steineri TaxID=433720 RepID=A0A820J537_9BILA|nr:unnamed protein product [Adineta steineri]
MATINNNSTSLEPIAVIGIAYKFAGDIHCANDLWYTLKESQDVGSATTIDRFDLESFTADMLNINNNGQLHQKLLRAGYFIAEKVNGTKTSVHIGQFSTDHVIAAARMRPEHRSRFYGPNSLLYHFNLHDPNVSLDAACSSS